MWTVPLVLVVVAALAFIGIRVRSPRTLPPVGSQAPEFSLPAQDGSLVTLRDQRGKWTVLYFYPKDMTPGCTVEAHNFQRDQPEFAKRNAVVLGVSTDSADSHKRFCTKEGLNFKLLADTSHQVSKQYGSLRNFGVAQISARNTFVIDPEGKIARVFTGVNPARHTTEVLTALDQLEGTKASALRP
jgi:peroxiredoxin Q/BCP